MDERIKNIRGYKSDVIRASMANMLELGEILSQVVSSGPFASASVIFAAAKCLVGIENRYRNYFTTKNLLKIIESLRPHLERFKIYVGYAKKGITVQEPIVRYLFNLLEHFFQICGFYSVLESVERCEKVRRRLFSHCCYRGLLYTYGNRIYGNKHKWVK